MYEFEQLPKTVNLTLSPERQYVWQVSRWDLEPACMDLVLILPAKLPYISDLNDSRMTLGDLLNHFMLMFHLHTVMNESINYTFV